MSPAAKSPVFSDLLQRLLDERGMTRADLAKLVWGTIVDERGYTVAKNRQALSKYIAGKASPSRQTRLRIAEALGVPYTDLFPEEQKVNRPGSGITLEPASPPGVSRLRLDVEMPTKEATKVIEIVAPYAR